MNAHFLFDRPARERIAGAERAIFAGEEFGNDEERYSLGSFRRPFNAREHEVDDVFRKIMLAGGNKYLGAGDFVASVGLDRGAAAHKPKIGSALRLGQVHRAGPLTADEFGQVQCFLLGRPMNGDRRGRSLGESRIHGESHVRRAKKFADRLSQHHRQALTAKVLGR